MNFIKKLIKYVIVYPLVAIFGVAMGMTIVNYLDPENVQAREEAQIEREAELAAEDAEKRRKGFHCLSSWDGSNRQVVRTVENSLRNPDSFEHISTRITPVAKGKHTLIMEYRGQNGFGGMSAESVIASISNSNCSVIDIVSM